ncbi:hypothetical protein HYH03_018025 [Edaphochlamys debaryana]|uniref:SBP-type domain-containing protein n=1 Tax=Edaphochlamys debaryana TaxID=47281 RepID=A0A836BNJ4_9CHLO|nr:hypothetical protein HYH03_018025 [Edaphochlamys debaryana]|eukprot:KAG2483085.1 hypothetical protein HYH03_018025 [Edaphochlamys debaryana]
MPVKGVDSDALETLIRAFYTAECPLELPRVPALYDAAVKLEVPSLAPALEQYLGGALQPHNCCHTLELCIGAGATPLADLVLEWIRNRVTDVVPHAEFWSCRLETAAIICKDLSHVSQLLALQAAVAWLSALGSRNNLLGVFSEASGLSPEAIQAVAASGATLGGPLGLVGSGGGNDRLGGPGLGLGGLGNSGVSLKLQSGPGGLGPDGLAGGPSSGPGPILQLLPNSNNAGAMLVSPPGGGGGGLGPGVGLGGGGGGLQVDPSLGPGMGLGSLLSKGGGVGGGGGGAGFGLDALADAAEGERVQKRLRPGAGAGGGGGGGGGFGDRSGSATPMHSGDLSADSPLQLGGSLAALRGAPPRDLDGHPLGGPMGHVSMGGGGNHHAHPTGSGGRPRSKPSSGSGGAGGGGGSGGRAGGGGGGRRKRGASDDDDEDYAPVGGRGGGGGRGSRAQEMVYDADAVLTDEQAGGSGPGDDDGQGGGGGDGDGEGGSGGAPGSTPVLMTGRRAPAQKGQCHVQGCNRSLLGLRDYYQRYKICEHHLKVSSVLKDGVPHRFCQQCGRFHPLSEFDGDRRSCRTMLQRHCHRRAKQKQELAEVLAQRYEEKQVAASLSAVVSALTRGGGADLPPGMLGLPLLAGLAPGAGGGGGALDDLSLALGGGGGGGSNGGGKGRRSGLPPGLHSPPSKAQLLEAVQRARKQHANLAQQQLMELAGDAPLAAAVAAAVATGGGGLDDVGGGGSRGGGGDGRLGGLDDLVGRGGGGGGSHDGSGDDGGGGDRGGGGGGRVLDVKPEPLQGSDGGGGGSDVGGGDGGGADRPGA